MKRRTISIIVGATAIGGVIVCSGVTALVEGNPYRMAVVHR